MSARVVHDRAPAIGTAVAFGVLVVAGFVWRAHRDVAPVADPVAAEGGSLGWPVVIALLVLVARVAFRAGQYARGYSHARGIRRSHWRSIRGEH